MSNMKHTPEPWGIDPVKPTAIMGNDKCLIGEGIDRANADRIVQCVNACAGMLNPEDVIRFMKSVKIDPHGKPDFGSVISEMEQLQSEIARLREALRALLYECTTPNGMDRTGYDFAIMQASEALKGGPHETR